MKTKNYTFKDGPMNIVIKMQPEELPIEGKRIATTSYLTGKTIEVQVHKVLSISDCDDGSKDVKVRGTRYYMKDDA